MSDVSPPPDPTSDSPAPEDPTISIDDPQPTTSEPPPPSTTDEPEPSPTPTSVPNNPDPTSAPPPDPTTTPDPDPTTTNEPPPTTTGRPDPTTTTTVITTTDDDQPTSTPDNPTSDNTSTSTPTTSPEQSTSDNNNQPEPTPTPSSSEIHVTSVISSGTDVYTVTSTSYTMIIPTETSSLGSEGSTNTGAIAGGVVGGVAFIGIIGALAFLFLRRRRNKNRKSTFGDLDDPYGNYPDMEAAGPLSPGSSSGGAGSSNARPLVAPFRPVSKVGEDDPNMTYAGYRDPSSQGGSGSGPYYEDASPHTSAHYSQPSTGAPSTGVPAYYTGMHDEQYPAAGYGQQEQGYYPQQQAGAGGYWPEGSSDGGDRHVPHLVEGPQANDVPHSRT